MNENKSTEVSTKKLSYRNEEETVSKAAKRERQNSTEHADDESRRKIIKKSQNESILVQNRDYNTNASNVNAMSFPDSFNSDEPGTQQHCKSKGFEIDRMDKDADDSILTLQSEFGDEFDDLFNETFDDETKPSDFGEFRLCEILMIKKEQCLTKITVKQSSEHSESTILCYGFWRNVKIQEKDVVSIKAKKELDNWIIDNENGFLVTQPHTLVSGTSIVGAHFCIRRGILNDRFRGLDSLPNLEIDDCGMTVGNIVHEVLQKVLLKKQTSISDVRRLANEILNSRRGAQMLFNANLSMANCKRQVEAYIPQIVKFVQRYIVCNSNNAKDKNFKGKIERIREIEENIWLPALGIKGKIDVTVDATVNLNRKIMPLEIKTGNPSFSSEHRGQLVLYNMMLSALGHDVDTGLLLYLRENIVQEVKNNHPEERDLIILRNSFVNFSSKVPTFKEAITEDGSVKKIWKTMDLPEPINNHYACSKCPYNTLCSIYAERDEDLDLPEAHALKKIATEATNYLKTEHIDYVMKWITMLRLEDSPSHDLLTLKDIWMVEPRKREMRGGCICELEVCGDVVEEGSRYLHTFVRKNQNEKYSLNHLSDVKFTEVDYIIVSTDTRINVSAGFLKKKSQYAIELLLDRDVARQNPMATFHVDKTPFTGLQMRNLANVACLFNDNEITNKLRRIVIDKEPATFAEKLPKSVVEFGATIFFGLNKYQRAAILRVLSANDYLLIKGMPGTGKTQTLVALIELLIKMGRSILITAHTHSAVDNILLKLDERGIDFLRLGSQARLNPALSHKSEDVITANCKTPECLEILYRSKQVVAVTCFGAVHSLVARRIFDICLVDESTQVLQPTVLKPLYSASKFVLVGDPQQLPPVIRNDDARMMGMDESLFARLDSPNNTVTLKLQYRMNRKIMSVANHLIYEGHLKAGNNGVACATLRIKDPMVLECCEAWIAKTLSANLEESVVMLNTGQTHNLNKKCFPVSNCSESEMRIQNEYEAAIILRLVSVLQKCGVDPNSIGIICPFRGQVELLRDLNKNIEVNTVDQYQGRDKDVILYSCTRSTPDKSIEPKVYEVLQGLQRLNVAITRAKHKLIIIGDKLSLQRFTPFEKLFNVIKENIVDLKPGSDDFSWDNLMDIMK